MAITPNMMNQGYQWALTQANARGQVAGTLANQSNIAAASWYSATPAISTPTTINIDQWAAYAASIEKIDSGFVIRVANSAGKKVSRVCTNGGEIGDNINAALVQLAMEE